MLTHHRRVARGGAALSVARSSLNGGGPTALFVHATGFCKEVWDPVIEDAVELGLSFEAVRMDQRAHGQSTGIAADWWELGRDVLAVAGGSAPLIGVGHSSGGAALILAELLRPATFAALILIEPIVPPPPYERNANHPFAKLAEYRRPGFANLAAAADAYRGRGPFTDWDERALLAYVEGGFVPSGDGGVRLACRPEDEAEFYRSAPTHGAYDRLGELTTRVVVLYGAASTDLGPGFFATLGDRIRGSEVEELDPGSHFVPMERPGVIAQRIAAVVSEYGK